MAYQVLARKWRPQDFTEVVGQQPIVTALRNALSENRIAQAYLFSGIRGVGKTSVARILAKALNCEQGPTADPCNECVSCTEITASSGSNLDVHEIDAATHSKVEQVRELTEGLRYGPARDRYKVVIIDEIHRLSRQAFDALLKIVEEPPPHLVFIFATTESEAVPVTILSRCQEFRFRRVPSQALTEHLKKISGKEGLEVSDKALRLIARAGDGSVRDSVALLDQLATFGSGKIVEEEAARVLGGVDHALFQRLLASIVAGDSRAVSAVVHEVENLGWDPRHVYGEFLNYSRDALHLALGGGAAEIELPDEEVAQLEKVAKSAGYENLLRLLNQLLNSEMSVRRSEMGSLALEICWLRAAELPKLQRVEEILGGRVPESHPPPQEPPPDAGPASSGGGSSDSSGSIGGSAPEGSSSGRLFTPSLPPEAADSASDSVPAEAAEPPREPPAGPPPGPPPGMEEVEPIHVTAAQAPPPEMESPTEIESSEAPDREATLSNAQPAGDVGRFLDEVSRRKLPLAAHLREAQEIRLVDGKLKIFALPNDAWLNTASLQRPSNRTALEDAIVASFGDGVDWKVVESDAPPAPPATGAAPEMDEVTQDPRVQKVLDIFGGQVEAVEDR